MTQHKKAVLIGAGEESLHTIEKARELGVFVTALDGNSEAAGLKAADEGLAVDISREDEVLKALQDKEESGGEHAGPDFVITGPIGRYLTTAGAVNDAFQLRGISRQSAVWCTDKYLFHEKLHAAGLRECHCERVPAFCGKDAAGVRQTVDNLMKKAEEEFSFPAILKPRYGSGSRGIFFLNSLEELRTALGELSGENCEKDAKIHAASDEDYVLEEAVSGEEYGVDAAMDGKKYCQILLRRKLLTPPPARQAVGYFSVTGREEREACLISLVRDYLERVTAVLELQDCLLHADLMILDERIFAIELSARPSGHHLHDLFTPLATGVDMAEAYIRRQCGLSYTYAPQDVRRLLIRYFALPEGVVKSVPKKEELALPKGVCLRAWDCEIRPGDRLERVTTGHSVMGRGYFILEGDSDEALEAAADGVLGKFAVEQQEEPLAKVITPPEIDFEAEGLVQKEGVVYTTHSGKAYRMDIVYPADAKKALPTVVWVHGGGWSDENLTRKYLPSTELARLAGRGFVTVSVDYRLSQEAPFPAQIEDCKAAVRFLRAHAEEFHVDPERIAAWGESAGGHLVELMAYSTDQEFQDECCPGFSSRIQAVIPWYAPVDLRMNEEEWKASDVYQNLFAFPDPEERERMMEAASPICYASRTNPPTLLMHGDADRLVSLENSRRMYEALKAAGNDVRLITIPGQGHGFFDGEEYYEQIFRFLEEVLS